MKRVKIALIGAVAFEAAGSVARATYTIESDVLLRVASNKIVTDAVDDATGNIVNNVHYFGYRFQEEPEDPYFVQDPGFIAGTGSGLPAGSQVSFDIVRHLSYWSGAAAVSFVKPPNGESLQFNFGAANAFVTGDTNQVNGFVISNIAADGSMHRHLNAFLHGVDGATNPSDGIYFTNLRLRSSDSGITRSDSLYIVYNNGLSPSQFTAALSYLNDPFPGDANFDGVVNANDFTLLASNFGRSDRFWYEGDFNGDRVVNASDFTILASHFGQAAPLDAIMVLPEPDSLFILTLVTGITSRRQRPRYRGFAKLIPDLQQG